MILSNTAFNRVTVLVMGMGVLLIAFCHSAADMMDLANRLIDTAVKLCWSREVKATNRVFSASTAREESIVEGSLVDGTSAKVAELKLVMNIETSLQWYLP